MGREIWCLVHDDPEAVVLLRRIESADVVGDLQSNIRPGQVVAGLSYDDWRRLPAGRVQIEFRDGAAVSARPIERNDDDAPYKPLRRIKP